MMSEAVLVESKRQLVELTKLQAASLRVVGKQLASSKAFWGDEQDETDPTDEAAAARTVIRCVHAADDLYEVTVNEAVGIVVLPDLQLIVQPKIPLDHFHYLMSRSPLAPRVIEEDASGAQAKVLWDLVARWYLVALERLLRQGLLSDYEEKSDDLRAVRGSLRIHDTALAYYQGSTLLACDFDEFNADTALNRVLRAAALAVAQAQFFDPALRRRARRAMARLDEVGELRRGDLRAAVDRRTGRYDAPVALARQVLASTGRTFASGMERAQTFLIRTPDLVEEAVRSVLRLGLAEHVPVTKRGLQLVGSKLRLNPDLVFGEVATGDVKYKLLGNEWKRSDLYQAVAFATGYRVSHAVIIAFSPVAQSPASVSVGPVRLQPVTWDCSPDTPPESSALSVVAQAIDWLAVATPHATSLVGSS